MEYVLESSHYSSPKRECPHTQNCCFVLDDLKRRFFVVAKKGGGGTVHKSEKVLLCLLREEEEEEEEGFFKWFTDGKEMMAKTARSLRGDLLLLLFLYC